MDTDLHFYATLFCVTGLISATLALLPKVINVALKSCSSKQLTGVQMSLLAMGVVMTLTLIAAVVFGWKRVPQTSVGQNRHKKAGGTAVGSFIAAAFFVVLKPFAGDMDNIVAAVIKMCRSFMIIQNIENTSIDELLVYMNRRLRLYGVFFVIALVTFILAYDYHTTYLAFTIVTLVLYLLSMAAILQLKKNPTSRTALYPIITAVIVLAFNIFSMVFTLIKSGNLWALITLISIVLQISTLFVLHKLREKLVNRELGRDDDDAALEQPIENSSTHNNSAHGAGSRQGSAHGSAHGGKHLSMSSTGSSGSHNSSTRDIENPVHQK
eukprot:gene9498-11174_t